MGIQGLINEIISKFPNEDISIKELLITQKDYLGYISYIDNTYKDNVAIVSEIKINSYGTPFLTLYRIKDGKSITLKTDKKYYNEKPLSQYEIIQMNDIKQKNKRKKIDGKWTVSDEIEFILMNYSRVIEGEVYEG